MSRLRGRSQNRERQESCPGEPGAASQYTHFGAAKARPRFIGLLLALVTLLVYLPAAHHGFVIYDDGNYVTENHFVQNGLTWAGIKWAFTTGHASNWHPMTWLSLMADFTLAQVIDYWLSLFGCKTVGLNAGVCHSVNVLFHVANVVLLFALLLRLTGLVWPAAFAVALFAWHPLHVESVAWVSERKDVLSTFFALLTLLAYAKAVTGDRCQVTQTNANLSPVTRHSSHFYWLALVCFALGLMAKPMLVTLPFVMLLLDYWPLGRISECGVSTLRSAATEDGRSADSGNATRPSALNPQLSTLLFEKWPFFLLTAASCVTTFLAQSQRGSGAVVSLEQVSLSYRLCNALTSYGRYLLKTIWPADLAVFYPLSEQIVRVRITAIAAAVGLAAISWFVWQKRRPYPYLLVGWLWFLGTLVPVIGLVQVGSAALADRYTYFPLIGPFVAGAFGARDLASRLRLPKVAVGGAAALVLAACLLLTARQLRHWHDSVSLFAHTIAVTTKNAHALNNYGAALEEAGRPEEALARYQEAVRIAPDHILARYNFGNLLDKLGRSEEARVELLRAVLLDPTRPTFHKTLGVVLVKLGRFDEALGQLTEAGRLDPRYAWVPFEIGLLYLKQGRDAEATDEFRKALRLDPDNFQVLASVAHVLAANENPGGRDGKAALVLALKANTLTGSSQPFVLDVLGMACAAEGRFDEAQQAVQRAIDLATAAKMNKLEPLHQRLQLYRNHQPWRESFLATNVPPAGTRKN